MRTRSMSSRESFASLSSSSSRNSSPRDHLRAASRETKPLEPSPATSLQDAVEEAVPEAPTPAALTPQEETRLLSQRNLQAMRDLFPRALIEARGDAEFSKFRSAVYSSLFSSQPEPRSRKETWSLNELGFFTGYAWSLDKFLARLRHCHERCQDDAARARLIKALPLCMAGPSYPWYQRLSQSFKDDHLKDLAGWSTS